MPSFFNALCMRVLGLPVPLLCVAERGVETLCLLHALWVIHLEATHEIAGIQDAYAPICIGQQQRDDTSQPQARGP